MSTPDHHFQRENRAARWQRIARQVAAHPEELDAALETISRWQTHGRVHPAPLLAWRQRILAAQQSPAAFSGFLDYLAADNHDSEPLKSCSPFVGSVLHASAAPTP